MTAQGDPLEQLLEKFASDQVPNDLRHQYALRRALLNSTQFESNAAVQAMWGQWITATGTVIAGGAAMAVFVVSVRIADMAPARTVSIQPVRAERTFITTAPAMETMDRLWSSFQSRMVATAR